MDSNVLTDQLDRSVILLQTVVAAMLVVLFLVGVINLGILITASIVEGGVLDPGNVITAIISSVDIILYLFIVVELYRTIIAYVEAKNVVLAVINAGLIAVVRQVITFQPADAPGPTQAFVEAGTHALLLLALLAGFFVVHRQVDDEQPRE